MTVGKRAGHKPRGSKKRVRHGRQKRGERRKSVAEGKFAGRFVVMIGNKTVSPQIRFWRVHHSLPAPRKGASTGAGRFGVDFHKDATVKSQK